MTESRSLMQAMYWSCADGLSLAARISTATDLPAPGELKHRIAALLDQMATKGIEAGLSRDDVEDARYAIVAFLDEQIFQSSWSGKQEWMLEPLQLTYYNENTAGEGFFKRLTAIEARPERAHLLQVYYLCLSLGFQGMYAVRGATALNALVEAVGAKLAGHLPSVDTVSPHGVPPDTGRRTTARQLPVIPLAVGLLLVALGAFVGLRLALSSSTQEAAASMHKAATQLSSPMARPQGR
jgi:type VI secretion system protein ImpK